MAFAAVFPGQGSQAVGMLHDLAAIFPVVQATFAEASEALKVDLWELAQNGPEQELARTEITQPLILTAAISAWRVWRSNGGAEPLLAAGHSLGEYSALVSAGVLTFVDAVRLVSDRGRFMQDAVPIGEGAMAAILGLGEEELNKVCFQATRGTEIATCANFNAPGQIVIAGHVSAVERASNAAREVGARRVIPLPVSAPFHCDLMQPAAERLRETLLKCPFSPPVFPVVNNVEVVSESEPGAIKGALYRQVVRPVQWVRTVEYFVEQGVDAVVEFGPGKVLSGMCKRTHKPLVCRGVYDAESLQEALDIV